MIVILKPTIVRFQDRHRPGCEAMTQHRRCRCVRHAAHQLRDAGVSSSVGTRPPSPRRTIASILPCATMSITRLVVTPSLATDGTQGVDVYACYRNAPCSTADPGCGSGSAVVLRMNGVQARERVIHQNVFRTIDHNVHRCRQGAVRNELEHVAPILGASSCIGCAGTDGNTSGVHTP